MEYRKITRADINSADLSFNLYFINFLGETKIQSGKIFSRVDYKKQFSGLKMIDCSEILDENILKDVLKYSNIIFGLEFRKVNDFSRQPNSGFDDFILQQMRAKNIIYGFCVEQIISSISKKQNSSLSRLIQNHLLLKKAKLPFFYFSLSGDKIKTRMISDYFKNIL